MALTRRSRRRARSRAGCTRAYPGCAIDPEEAGGRRPRRGSPRSSRCGEDHDGGGERRTARAPHQPATRLGPKRSASEPPRVGPSTFGANLSEDVQRRRLGSVGQIEEEDARGRRRSASRRTSRSRQPAGGARTDRPCGARRAARGKNRAVSIGMSTPGRGTENEARRRGRYPRRRTNGFSKSRADSGIIGGDQRPRLAPSVISASMDTAGTKTPSTRCQGWHRRGCDAVARSVRRCLGWVYKRSLHLHKSLRAYPASSHCGTAGDGQAAGCRPR